MDRKTQTLIYITGLMCALSNGFCKPVIKTYFFSLVSPDVIALSTMIETGLSALMMMSVSSKGMLSFYRSHYGSIIMISVSCLAVINYMALMDPAIRFIGMAVLDGFTDILWMLILKDAVLLHKNGEAFTVFTSQAKTFSLVGSLVGSSVMVLIVTPSIETVLLITTVVHAIAGFTNYRNDRHLRKVAEEAKGNRS